MTQFRRMLDEGASPVERWLLESAGDDVPPRDGARRLVRALGVGTGLASVAVASSLAQAAAEPLAAASASGTTLAAGLGHASAVGVSAAGSVMAGAGAVAAGGVVAGAGVVAGGGTVGATTAASTAATSKVLFVLGAKWLGAGLVAGAITTGTIRVATSPDSAEAPVPLTTAAAMSAAQSGEHGHHRVSQRASRETRPGSDELRTDDQGRGAASARAGAGDLGDLGVRPVPLEMSSGSRDPASIGAEVALVDQARGRLRSGDVSGALKSLAQYQQTFRSGAMWPEAARLRCEALRASGDYSAASSCAREFLALAPTSPHAARMQSMLARSEASNMAPTPARSGNVAAPIGSAPRAPALSTHSEPAAARTLPTAPPAGPNTAAPRSVAAFPDG